MLDCGLARVLKGGAGSAAAGASITGGVVGTLGCMAPELARGLYAPASDVYALVVVLELLVGARVGVDTAAELEDAAVEGGAGAAPLLARAEGCWPEPAKAALAELALVCIHSRARKRSAGMAAVGVRQRELRGGRGTLSATAAPRATCAA